MRGTDVRISGGPLYVVAVLLAFVAAAFVPSAASGAVPGGRTCAVGSFELNSGFGSWSIAPRLCRPARAGNAVYERIAISPKRWRHRGRGPKPSIPTTPSVPTFPSIPTLPPVVAPPPPDTAAPETTISSGPSGSTSATTASFGFSSSESGSDFACKLDSGSWGACDSPNSYSNLAIGKHTFSVRATDSAGNTDASPAARSWTVASTPTPPDTTAPETTISSGPSGSTSATTASFGFSASESGSTFACRLDGGSWGSCGSPQGYSGLAVGAHDFSVRATDSAGNTDASPAARSWTVASTPPPTGCTSTVSSVSAAQTALSSASPGQVVCLADGTYGSLALSSTKAAPGVTLRAANPGSATIGSVQVSGSGYTISRFVIDGGVTIARNTDRTVVDHNRILAGNHYGVFVCTATPPDQCDDTKIVGNLFDGAMDEDQIRANVFHDADGDGIGLLVEGNEFRGNTERGGHNDVFQSVWVGDHLVFNRNYLHDFGGQGFFVKDQATAIKGFIANDNLIVDQDRPCEPSTLCTGYQLSPWQIYGPISGGEMRNNTVGWGAGGGTAVLTGSYTDIDFSNNVFDRLSSTDGGGSVPTLTGTGNTYCNSSGWSVPAGTTKDCAPAFLNPAAGDYRLASGRGVTWVPADQHYGP